ncbi:hypothetical protein [Streptomyces sp. NPDC058254]|uniref:hypothetical protein n=1 Tax=Streptomyces sp. NPDC058254 TaxID=3346406 RepID=UPI0036EEBE6C
MTTIGIPPRSQDDWDRPAREVAADVKAHVARQRCQILADAAMRSSSPSDRIAYALDADLLLHPETLTVETPAGWDHHIAQLVELNEVHREAAEFNRLHPVGTPVMAYPGVRPDDPISVAYRKRTAAIRAYRGDADPCTRLETATRSAATVLGGHTAVVWVEGHSACIALSHIDIRPGGAS